MVANSKKDCIVRPDGGLIYWDKESGKLYSLSKREITFNDLSKEDLVALMSKLSSRQSETVGTTVPITQEDLELFQSIADLKPVQ